MLSDVTFAGYRCLAVALFRESHNKPYKHAYCQNTVRYSQFHTGIRYVQATAIF